MQEKQKVKEIQTREANQKKENKNKGQMQNASKQTDAKKNQEGNRGDASDTLWSTGTSRADAPPATEGSPTQGMVNTSGSVRYGETDLCGAASENPIGTQDKQLDNLSVPFQFCDSEKKEDGGLKQKAETSKERKGEDEKLKDVEDASALLHSGKTLSCSSPSENLIDAQVTHPDQSLEICDAEKAADAECRQEGQETTSQCEVVSTPVQSHCVEKRVTPNTTTFLKFGELPIDVDRTKIASTSGGRKDMDVAPTADDPDTINKAKEEVTKATTKCSVTDHIPEGPLLSKTTSTLNCDTCSRQFVSCINYRRHMLTHDRPSNKDKELAGDSGLLQDYWDGISKHDFASIVSLNIKEEFRDPVLRCLEILILKPEVILPRAYVKAGNSLLDVVRSKWTNDRIGSEELFKILNNASEQTFLCSVIDDSVRNQVFERDDKVSLENVVALICFLLEANLVEHWNRHRIAQSLVDEEENEKQRQEEMRKRLNQKAETSEERKGEDEKLKNVEDASALLHSGKTLSCSSPSENLIDAQATHPDQSVEICDAECRQEGQETTSLCEVVSTPVQSDCVEKRVTPGTTIIKFGKFEFDGSCTNTASTRGVREDTNTASTSGGREDTDNAAVVPLVDDLDNINKAKEEVVKAWEHMVTKLHELWQRQQERASQ